VDPTDESLPTLSGHYEAEVKAVMGLFDVPAFARRGLELDETLGRMQERCRRARAQRLDMVRVRLRQWSRAVTGPTAWTSVLATTIEPLWPMTEAEPPQWADAPAPLHRQVRIAGDLIASVLRFNQRWTQFFDRLNLEPANRVIDHYNRYYVLEKECVMGSARLAARFFKPFPKLTREYLLRDHPLLPVPELLDRIAPAG
jgi:hypothetical protein